MAEIEFARLNDLGVQPIMDEGVPMCSRQCPSYVSALADVSNPIGLGFEHCKINGLLVHGGVCIPRIKEDAEELTQLRARGTRDPIEKEAARAAWEASTHAPGGMAFYDDFDDWWREWCR